MTFDVFQRRQRRRFSPAADPMILPQEIPAGYGQIQPQGFIEPGSVGTDQLDSAAEIQNVRNGPATVTIDDTGIRIEDGALTFIDEFGETILTGGGFGATWLRFIESGVFNGDFTAAPPTPASNIDDSTNPLPYWTGPTAVSGSAVTFKSVADAARASGRRIDVSLASGAANDEAYIEQIVPIASSSVAALVYAVSVAYKTNTDLTPEAIQLYLETQFVTSSGATVGTADRVDGSTERSSGAGEEEIVSYPNDGDLPATATGIRIRIGMDRNTAANSDTVTTQVYETRVTRGSTAMYLPPTTENIGPLALSHPPMRIFHGSDGLSIQPLGAVAPVWAIDSDGVVRRGDGTARGDFVAPVRSIPRNNLATASLTLTTADQAITGASRAVNNSFDETVLVMVTFDFNVTGAGVGVCVGKLYVDGVAQSAQALYGPATTGRSTVSQTYAVSLAAGSHTLELRASKTINAGTAAATTQHTTLSILEVGDS